MHLQMAFLSPLSFLSWATIVTLAAAQLAAPSVNIRNGTVIGSSLAGVDSFKGIPYAQPPTGAKRLRPPVSIQTNYGTIKATGTPTSCPQFQGSVNNSILPLEVLAYLEDTPLFQNITNGGEDCLTINVQRPSGTNSSSKLPILFWIYGGGFETGSASQNDGSPIVSKSVALGQPIIFVAVNYRLGGFGFLAGKELSEEGSTNLGLRDQRMGLEWVQDNIAAFGGDPEKVTIFGESAGSLSVNYHLVINSGDNSYNGGSLFRAAIGDSGAINPVNDVTNAVPQRVFDEVVADAGCNNAQDKVECLRELPYEDFLNAANSQPALLSYRSVDVSYYPRPDKSDGFLTDSPEILFQQGKYVKCPIIIGDQEDEGSAEAIFTPNITTNQDLVDYFSSYFPTLPSDIPEGLVNLYPSDPSEGCPFRTGDLYEIYPQFKRVGALIGDFEFTLKRRIYLDYISGTVPSWSYLATYDHAIPILGTFHASDVALIYNGIGSPFARDAILTYYIAFVNNLDPNKVSSKAAPLINWPRYDTTTRSLLEIGLANNSVIPDTFRQEQYEYLKEHISDLRY